MSLTTLLLEFGLVAAGFYGLRESKHWLFRYAFAAGVVGSLVSIVTYLAERRFWWFAPWDLVLTPAVVAVAALALAPRLRNPSGWAEARFDRDLHASLVELDNILNNGPAQQDRAVVESWIAQTHERALSIVHTLERMKAPSREWNDLLEAYVELIKKTVAAIPTGATADERQSLVVEGDDLLRRYESLRLRIGTGSRAK